MTGRRELTTSGIACLSEISKRGLNVAAGFMI